MSLQVLSRFAVDAVRSVPQGRCYIPFPGFLVSKLILLPRT